MPSIKKKFGEKVRSLRTQRGWTQEVLAHKAGKHWTYIGGIERGTRNPTITVASDIARALNVKLEDLFEGLN